MTTTETATPVFDPDFLEATYRITAIEVMRGLAPIATEISRNADDFGALVIGYLAKFGQYLVCLSDDEKAELSVLLSERLESEADAELAGK